MAERWHPSNVTLLRQEALLFPGTVAGNIRYGRTVIVITHDPRIVAAADDVLRLPEPAGAGSAAPALVQGSGDVRA